MSAHPNYSRMPGPGDLPARYLSMNDPSVPEPSYGEDDAARDVAKRMDLDDMAVMLQDLADAESAIRIAMRDEALGRYARQNLHVLLQHSRTARDLIARQMEVQS